MSAHRNLIPIIHLPDDKILNVNTNANAKNFERIATTTKYRVVGIVYALFCSLIGIVLTTTEPFKTCGHCGGPLKIAMEGFLIYLYYVSIAWFIFMFISISIAKRQNNISIKNHHGFNRRLSTFIRSKESLFSTKVFESRSLLKTRKSELSTNITVPKTQFSIDSSVNEDLPAAESPNIENNFRYTYDFDNGTGELYMRVGTGILSLCTMIDIGLNLVKILEKVRSNSPYITDCKSSFTISVFTELGAFIFTFIQCFFIFKHANIVINKGKNLANFGLCHLVCTNFVVTLRNIINETVFEIKLHEQHTKSHDYHPSTTTAIVHNFTTSILNTTVRNTKSSVKLFASNGCWNASRNEYEVPRGIHATQERIAPYLFACIIEYSLMCMTIFYIIWENMNKNTNNTENEQFKRESNEKLNVIVTKPLGKRTESRRLSLSERLHVNKFTVDCGKSATGLFIGLFILISTVISLIVYFIYKYDEAKLAVVISEWTELILVVISGTVCVLAFTKLKKFGYKDEKVSLSMNYNELLVVIALAGIYLFSLYSMVAIIATGVKSLGDVVTLSLHIVTLIEGTIQCAFILEALKRVAKDLRTRKEKPARSLITLLILINLSLWLSETFSVKKYDMNTTQLDYYEIIFWSIASSIASPLAIFYRFHSSVCLSDIWKDLYE